MPAELLMASVPLLSAAIATLLTPRPSPRLLLRLWGGALALWCLVTAVFYILDVQTALGTLKANACRLAAFFCPYAFLSRRIVVSTLRAETAVAKGREEALEAVDTKIAAHFRKLSERLDILELMKEDLNVIRDRLRSSKLSEGEYREIASWVSGYLGDKLLTDKQIQGLKAGIAGELEHRLTGTIKGQLQAFEAQVIQKLQGALVQREAGERRRELSSLREEARRLGPQLREKSRELERTEPARPEARPTAGPPGGGRKPPTEEELRKLESEGWRFSKFRAKGREYVRIRRRTAGGREERSLGRLDEEMKKALAAAGIRLG